MILAYNGRNLKSSGLIYRTRTSPPQKDQTNGTIQSIALQISFRNIYLYDVTTITPNIFKNTMTKAKPSLASPNMLQKLKEFEEK